MIAPFPSLQSAKAVRGALLHAYKAVILTGINMEPRSTLALVLATLMLASSGNAFAIDKDKHKAVTLKAIEAYKGCLRDNNATDHLAGNEAAIANAARAEDEKPLMERALNWHFYDAYRGTEHAMGRFLLLAKKSLHDIFETRVRDLAEALENRNEQLTFDSTGRVAHYLQDMTVPAHVAPIYHAKFLWIDHSDLFDSMTIDETSEWEKTEYSPKSGLCAINYGGVDGLQAFLTKLLEDTAKSTIARIKRRIPIPAEHPLHGKTWEVFWTLREPGQTPNSGVMDGFAPYGEQGNEGFRQFCISDRAVCMSFFHESFDSAMDSTVKALLYVNRAVSKR